MPPRSSVSGGPTGRNGGVAIHGGRPFRYLNVNDVAEDATIGFFGPRGCGKTTAMTSILKAKALGRGIAMCPTPEAFTTYSEYIPLPYIYDAFDEPALDRIMNFQKAARFRLHQIWRFEMAQLELAAQQMREQRWQERMQRLQELALARGWTKRQLQIAYERARIKDEEEERANSEMRAAHGRNRKKELRRPYSMFIILDDLSSDKATMKSQLLKQIINNGRHFMLLLCVAVQYVVDFPAACRGGLDWVCLFFDSLEPNIERLYKYIVGVFPDLHSFKAALSDACSKGCCLMIKKNVPTSDPWDCVFYFKPEPTHLSTQYFGDACYEFVSDMFLDEEKFHAAIGASQATAATAAGNASATARSGGRGGGARASPSPRTRRKPANDDGGGGGGGGDDDNGWGSLETNAPSALSGHGGPTTPGTTGTTRATRATRASASQSTRIAPVRSTTTASAPVATSAPAPPRRRSAANGTRTSARGNVSGGAGDGLEDAWAERDDDISAEERARIENDERVKRGVAELRRRLATRTQQ